MALSTSWNIQAGAYSIVAMLFLTSILYASYWPSIAYKLDKSIWTEVENTPLPEGVRETYFPDPPLRFENTISDAPKFCEFAIEETTAFQREGWLGYGFGQVSKRTFNSIKEADQALQMKMRDSEHDFYQQVFGKSSK